MRFAVVLVVISISVLTWSYYYMSAEVVYARFFGLVIRFLVSIFLLVFSRRLLGLFVGWDLLGFTSFFLVSYYGNRVSFSAALLTGLTNRLGDCFFFVLLGLVLRSSLPSNSSCFYVLLLIRLTKSAQLPFASWLPAAMYAPTPVSALVHRSTLVTAGVYLLLRFGGYCSYALVFLGVLTSLVGGISASLENDIKKVVALSTLSQLGIMMAGLGLGFRVLTFNHLLRHAIFKALLFLSIGTVIHSCFGSQEGRSPLILSSVRVFTWVALRVSLLSLSGFCFLSGFFSKDALLEAGISVSWGLLPLFGFYTSIGLTVTYSFRIWYSLNLARCSSSTFCPLLGAGVWSKLPTLLLLLALFFQSMELDHASPLFFACLRVLDMAVLGFILVLGLVLGLLLEFTGMGISLPMFWLGCVTGSGAGLSAGASLVSQTEVGSVLALGSSKFSKLVRVLCGTDLFNNSLLCCLLMIILFC